MEQEVDKDVAKERIKEILMLIPNYVKLLYRLVQDQKVPAQEKYILLATVAYVLSPLDFMPDFIPFIGQVDDVLLVALVLKRFMNSVDHQVLADYWDGSYDLLTSIERILSYSRFLLPRNIYERIVKKSQDTMDADYEVK
jgi:uncharacterized membrane protein YkvA (DUF1232 family)